MCFRPHGFRSELSGHLHVKSSGPLSYCGGENEILSGSFFSSFQETLFRFSHSCHQNKRFILAGVHDSFHGCRDSCRILYCGTSKLQDVHFAHLAGTMHNPG